jgi:hypothetical protein
LFSSKRALKKHIKRSHPIQQVNSDPIQGGEKRQQHLISDRIQGGEKHQQHPNSDRLQGEKHQQHLNSDRIQGGEKHPHPNSDKKCQICNLSFKKPCYLKSHMIKHSFQKPFKCDKCTKYYKREADLNNHKRKIHTDIENSRKKVKQDDDFIVSLDNLFQHYYRDPPNFLRQGGSSNFPTQGGGKSTNMVSCPVCGENIDSKDIEIHNMINHL